MHRLTLALVLSLLTTAVVAAQPDLGFYPTSQQPDAAPDGISTVEFPIMNAGAVATNAVLVVDLPDGARFIEQTGDRTFICELAGAHATCRAPSVPPTANRPYPKVTLRFANPPLYGGGWVQLTATISSAEPDLDPRGNTHIVGWFVRQLVAVTTAEDSGPGSLRQAILDANAGCAVRCFVDFRLPGPLPAEGYFTVRPRTPLPAAAFNGSINGTTQADLLGIVPGKPVVMLDGSAQRDGDGITIGSGLSGVNDVAIGRFPRFGIVLQGPDDQGFSVIDGVWVGVDPAGNAAPNFRGIVQLAPWVVQVQNSVIRYNRASGVAAGNGRVYIQDNRIESNGASGIYLAQRSTAYVTRNVLANNHDFGIGQDAYQRSVELTRNSIHDNGAGIDIGLDGPNPNAADDSRRQPNTPTIESARYDEAKQQTIVVVREASRPAPPLVPNGTQYSVRFGVELFANASANAQAERFLATSLALPAQHSWSPDGVDTITFTVSADLRGQWLTATTIRARADCVDDANCATLSETSEISPPLYVAP